MIPFFHLMTIIDLYHCIELQFRVIFIYGVFRHFLFHNPNPFDWGNF